MKFSSINSTAVWTASLRAQEHDKGNSINDPYAKLFLHLADDQVLDRFKNLEKPKVSIISRYQFIDEYLSDILESNSEQDIVSIGSGFDCRPFRLKKGKWYEFDQTPVIQCKDDILPAHQCPNSLKRICGDITSVDFLNDLKDLHLHHPVFVIEGVINYLPERDAEVLLKGVKTIYPDSVIICDMMNATFYNKYAKDFRNVINSIGLHYQFLRDDTTRFLSELKFTIEESHSIVDLTIKQGMRNVPKLIRNLFLRKLFEGYTLYILR
jgi:methyltransferase (TIGR00027 family)